LYRYFGKELFTDFSNFAYLPLSHRCFRGYVAAAILRNKTRMAREYAAFRAREDEKRTATIFTYRPATSLTDWVYRWWWDYKNEYNQLRQHVNQMLV
jgi:hypothetical protein